MDPQADFQGPAGPWIYLLPLIGLAVLVARNSRPRRLRVEWLWLSPLVLIVLAGLIFSIQPPPGPVPLAADLGCLALGGLAGWWRGRFTHIAVEPATHRLTSKSSPAGLIFILALFVVRNALRTLGEQNAGRLHLSALEVTEALMLLAVGLVSVQRLEVAVRARRLLREARR